MDASSASCSSKAPATVQVMSLLIRKLHSLPILEFACPAALDLCMSPPGAEQRVGSVFWQTWQILIGFGPNSMHRL